MVRSVVIGAFNTLNKYSLMIEESGKSSLGSIRFNFLSKIFKKCSNIIFLMESVPDYTIVFEYYIARI